MPPRPKPGRKPATDTPPTKRKAQNRAAQRAFRERRAARVGELEEELEETKEEQQKREEEMRKRISTLEADIQRFNSELQSWKMRCDTLDRVAEYERREKLAALGELSYIRRGALSTGTDAVPLPPRKTRRQEPRSPLTPQHYTAPPAAELEEHLGCDNCSTTGTCACVEKAISASTAICGKCTAQSHCECLEETIKAASEMPISMDLKRAHSPSIEEYSDKRHRLTESSTPLEVDFTAQFSTKSKQQTQPLQDQVTQVSTRPPTESCGFCDDGTYCMCAEAAAAALNNESEPQIPLPHLNEITPPPSDTDADWSTRQPRTVHPTVSNSCINGPGTCNQCQSDPKSGLFCRSLAAMRSSAPTSSPADGCCGGNPTGGQCCKSVPAAEPTRPPPSLSCADTYKTLSTHKNFDEASDELNSWLGKLHPTHPQHAERAPVEVEAASVMGVLKLFDRRFGRG